MYDRLDMLTFLAYAAVGLYIAGKLHGHRRPGERSLSWATFSAETYDEAGQVWFRRRRWWIWGIPIALVGPALLRALLRR